MAYGVYLVAVGPEGSFMTPEGGVTTTRSPSLAGSIPLGIGLLAFWAAVKHRTMDLWGSRGSRRHIFALLFLFSLALQFAVLATLLLVAAATSPVSARDDRRR